MTSLPLVSAKAKSRGSGLFDRSIVITAMELNESVAKKTTTQKQKRTVEDKLMLARQSAQLLTTTTPKNRPQNLFSHWEFLGFRV